VLALGVSLSVAAFTATRTSENRRRESEFKELAGRPVAAVQANIGLYVEEIQSIGRLYAASRFVEREEFGAFAQGIFPRRRSVEALQWAPRVLESEREAFEAEARRELSTDFQIREPDDEGIPAPAGRRPIYYPVWYVEPPIQMDAVLGLDLAASPVYRPALKMARAQDMIAATRPFPLPHDDESVAGVAVLLAVRHGGFPEGGRRAERTDEVQGFVVGVIRVADLVDEALGRVRTGFAEVSVYEEGTGRETPVLYPLSGDSRAVGADAGLIGEDAASSDMVHTAKLEVANRRWRMECRPTAQYLASTRSRMPWTVLAVGLLFTVLLTTYVMTTLGRAEWAERLVAQRTAELSEANEQLQNQIGERRQAEEALRIRNRELESFVYMASHDLRTPLVGVEGFARLLEEDYAERLDADGREYLSRVRANVADMDDLLSDLLELSRVTSREEPKEMVSVAEVVAQSLQQLGHMIDDAGAEVIVPQDLPTVCASPTRLRQVFANLIANGIKFSREDVAPRVEIAWEKLPDGYRFLVKDNGIGIPEKYREQIFELFTRLKDKDVSGTGIGLGIVQRIVEGHEGKVGVDSTMGEGSTFWFTLPRGE
jgi:signal transduction histidine kinase